MLHEANISQLSALHHAGVCKRGCVCAFGGTIKDLKVATEPKFCNYGH